MIRRVSLHGAAAVLLAAGLAAQVWRPLAPDVAAGGDVEAFFDAAYLARAQAYRRPLYAVALVALFVRIAVPWATAFTRAGRRMVVALVARIGAQRPGRAAAAVVVAVFALTDLALAPLAFWAGYVHEGDFGFRTQGLLGWVRDWTLMALLSWTAVALVALGGWTLARRRPRLWPPTAALSATALVALLAFAAPLVIEPLFLRAEPLPAGPARAAVERVLRSADVDAERIVVADASRRTRRENAYVSGLGATRRIVLFDTLVKERPPDEIGLVLAHELGHVLHADLARGVVLAGSGAVALIAALAWFVRWRVRRGLQADEADPRAAAAVAAVAAVLCALALPAQLAVSRRAEAAADFAALELTRAPAAYRDLHVGLAKASLADPAPPAWVRCLFMTHPPTAARLALVAQWADAAEAAG